MITVRIEATGETLHFPDGTPEAVIRAAAERHGGRKPLNAVPAPGADRGDEQGFRPWYAAHATRLGLNPDPDAPEHKYDYRAAFQAGLGPDESGHWPSRFKAEDHPNRFRGILDTKTGLPRSVSGGQLAITPEELPEDPGVIGPALRRGADAAAGWTVGIAERASSLPWNRNLPWAIPEGTRQGMRENLEEEREASLLHGNPDARAAVLGGAELIGGVAGSAVPGLSLGRLGAAAGGTSALGRTAAGAGLAATEGAVAGLGETAGLPVGEQAAGTLAGAALGGLAGAGGAAARAYGPRMGRLGKPLSEAFRRSPVAPVPTEVLAPKAAAPAPTVALPSEKPRIGAQVMRQYLAERQAALAQAETALAPDPRFPERPPPTPEEAAAHRSTVLKTLDRQWHERLRTLAANADEPIIHKLVDATEEAPEIKGAPKSAPDGGIIRRDLAEEPGEAWLTKWDRFVDQMSNRQEAPLRLLRRAAKLEEDGGHRAQADRLKAGEQLLRELIGNARGAARAARVPLRKGVYIYDDLGNEKRIEDSLHSILGGTDKALRDDLGDLMAAQHHMELVRRKQAAEAEYAGRLAARRAEVERLRTAGVEQKADVRRLEGKTRQVLAEELRLTRRQGHLAGARRAEPEKRAAALEGKQAHGEQVGALRETFKAGRAVAPAEVARYRERMKIPLAERPPDLGLEIDQRGTAWAQQKLADIAERYGLESDPVTGAPRVTMLQPLVDRLRQQSWAAIIETLDSVGYFAPGQKEALQAKNMEWAPFFRLLDDLDTDEVVSGGTARQPIKRISGGLSPDRPIAPPLESIVAQEQRVAVYAMRQRVHNTLAQLAEESPEIVGELVKPAKYGTPAQNTFGVVREGVRSSWTAPQDVLDALSLQTPRQAGYLMQAAQAVTRFARAGSVLALPFAERNFLRSELQAGGYGGEFRYRIFIDGARGLWAQTPLASPELREFVTKREAAGGALSDIISVERPQVQATVEEVAARRPGLQELANRWKAENVFVKLASPLLYPLEAVGQAAENAPRIGGFIRAKERGASDRTAAHFSRNIVLDFAEHGTVAQRINSVEAFFNASIRDVARFAQAMRNPKTALPTAVSAFAYITLPALANHYLNKDDPEYQSLPEHEKAAFMRVGKTKDGSPIRMPRPQGLLNLIFGYGVEKALEAAEAEGLGDQVDDFLAALFQDTPLKYSPIQMGKEGQVVGSAEWIPDIGQPAAEAGVGEQGWSSFRQAPIVPESLADEMPERRAFDTTTGAARAVGERLGVAPVKVDHLIRGYGRTLGFGAVALATGKGDLPELPPTSRDNPLTGGLIGPSPYGWASDPVVKFYRLSTQAAEAKKSLDRALDQADFTVYERLRKRHPEAALATMLAAQRQQLNELRDLRNTTRKVEGMDKTLRQDQLLRYDQMATQLTRVWMDQAADFLRGIRP